MNRIDSYPTHKYGGLDYRVGSVFPFGATINDGGVNFSIFSNEAESCTLVLFHKGEREPFAELDFTKEFRIGNVYTMLVYGLDVENTEYGYRFGGRYAPEEGLLFDRSRILLDPYAKAVSGRNVWGEKPDYTDPFQHRGQIIYQDYDWQGDTPLQNPQNELVIYEMHVRGFTRHPSSGVNFGGTYAGLIKKIPYLKDLGINCVELMPVFEFDEFDNYREYEGRRLYNYWGYATVDFFAPKAGYAASAPIGLEVDELKNMVKQLHKNGIEVILDVVFNHTAEGNENGPYISYRGIDNRTYYLLTPDGSYYNFSGCGNTTNCNHAVVRGIILDCLRYWVSEYHIDGFRFDLASILTRDESGAPMLTPPLIESLARDAVLGSCKLIAEAWDAGGLYQVGTFPSWNRWAEWNGRYRDCLRRFIKGGAECAPELYLRIGGSLDMYAGRGSAASINFITCHDGFTLYDLFSYNEKHNLANGEDNRDGCNNNDSWNCGAEGETDNAEINALRMRQMKNSLTVLLTSRGTPMLLAGDELANTQFGNNNAYCQDNEISWLDWSGLNKHADLHGYVKALIKLRRENPVFSSPDLYTDYNGTGYPELSFHSCEPWQLDMNQPALTFGYMYAQDGEKTGLGRNSFIYIAVNAHWEAHSFILPIVPDGMRWRREFCSFTGSYNEGLRLDDRGPVLLEARSTAVFIAEHEY